MVGTVTTIIAAQWVREIATRTHQRASRPRNSARRGLGTACVAASEQLADGKFEAPY
jgi:hypothetical protein